MAAGTLVTVQDATKFGGDEISFAAADGTDGNRVPAEAGMIIIVKVGATATVVTMDSVADKEFDREGDIVSASTTNGDLVFLPTKPVGFRQTSGDQAGFVHITYSQGTNVTIAAVRPTLN